MLESIRKGQRWLTGIFVAVIGLVFAAFIGLGGPLTPGVSAGTVVAVGPDSYGIPEYERIRAQQESRFRESLGAQFDAKAAGDFLDSQALRVLVDSAIMVHAAKQAGLRVSKDEIQREVRDIPGFRDEAGRFDQEQFIDTVEYQYGSQRNFLRVIRGDLLKQKLGRLLSSMASVSEGEAEAAARYRLEGIRIAFVALDSTELPSNQEVGDEEAQAFLDDHGDQVKALYDERRAEFVQAEAVQLRHILIQAGREDDEKTVAAARKRIEEARKRIEDGASFEDVAMEVSEDPGSKEKGGYLGPVTRVDTDPAIAEVAFLLEDGALSEIIRSDSGFHVLRAEGRRPQGETPLEEVELDLARELAGNAQASERSEKLATQLSEAVADGASLEDAARERALTLNRPGVLQRRPDGFVPELGAAPELLNAAFALDMENPSSPRIFDVDGRRVLIQLLEIVEVDEQELADATEIERDRLLEIERGALLQDWIDAEREVLSANAQLVVNSDLVTRR